MKKVYDMEWYVTFMKEKNDAFMRTFNKSKEDPKCPWKLTDVTQAFLFGVGTGVGAVMIEELQSEDEIEGIPEYEG